MPIPEPEMKAWLSVFADEMPGGEAPWFGVNIIETYEDTAEAQNRWAPVQSRVRRLPGVSTHFGAVRYYGARRRALSIVRYDEVIDPAVYAELFDNDDYLQEWLALGAVLESYSWFRTYEAS